MRVSRKPWQIVAGAMALGVVAMALSAACGNGGSDNKETTAPETSSAAVTLHDGMRKLWEDHITWTRLVIVSVAADLPDAGPTTDRLLQNQVDIGDAIKPYYGEQAGEQLTALLKDHIVTAAEILTAAKAGDSAKVDEAKARWYANGDEIATFLSQANAANWPLDEMKSMMRSHLDLTLKEAVARLQRDYPADIAAYDEVHQEILKMADMLSEGIVKQFTDKFAQ